ncbi:MAG: citrate lyase holo-[Prevotella sp.]|nr:citrate lyase holo-[acyl-carrier protein] synthase [Prevotella sp.]
MEITLDMLLASREKRWNLQRQFIQENLGLTLVCLTVIMPGNVKRNASSLIVANAAIVALQEKFGKHIHKKTFLDLETGYEAYFLVQLPLLECKRIACEVEDNHPLGRLFDIDVIDENVSPVPRSIIGKEGRKCLLCEQEARYCMRNHTHSREELQQKINQMIDAYAQ